MTFISYAQNHEDVMLWRALKHVDKGFYVDVGANHPSDDSVTRAFYDRGWSGINIEPLAEHIAQLRAARPRDINLQMAMGAEAGEVELFNTGVRGLATASSAIARMHRAAGLATSSSRVPLQRLDRIFAEYATGDVHFLKIDVEGFEREVLEGMDFARFRPWIVVVEATLPNSQEIDAHWEPILLDAGYRSVYFDGLNRYYTACEHEALAASFASPPNVFDQYISTERHRLRQCLEASITRAETAENGLWRSEERLRQSELRADLAEAHSRAVQNALDSLYTSASWRLTKPLRQLASRLRQSRQTNPEPTPTPPPATAQAACDEAITTPAPASAGPCTPRVLQASTPQERFDPAAIPAHPAPPETMFLTQEPPVAPQAYWFRILGHVESHYSLAIINRGLAIALDSLTQEQLSFIPYHLQPYDHPADLPESQKTRLNAMFERKIPANADNRTISIVHHYPLITDPEKSRYRFIVFFWEETAVPDATVTHINKNFEAVLVASEWVKRVLRNSGCHRPIFVIPIGIDHLIPPELPPIGALRPIDDRPFRFLHVSSVFERKGADILLQAFFAEFTANDPVELLIKTFPNPHNRIHEQLAELSHGRSDAPKVVIDETHLDDAGMLALYRSAQALVLPTRGEGFNLPAAEAMALGLPVIVTGYGAHLDFCTRTTALPIPFSFSRSRSHLKSSDACWVEPEVQALSDQMRVLRAEILTGDAALAHRRQAGLDQVRQTYTWQNSAQAVLKSVDWLDARQRAAQEPGPRRLSVLSPWMTRCGIAEYCQNLLCKFDSAYALQVYCEKRTPPNPEQSIYRPSWEIGNSSSVSATLDEILQERPDIVLVQHQPSLFILTDDICERMTALQRQGSVVILELHSTLELLHEYRESIVTRASIAALRLLDRIIVHKPEDLNHLLALGIVSNVLLLPLGVVQPRAASLPAANRGDWGIGVDDLVLGCFGFILPHKGIDTLVESIAPLAEASQRKVHLLGLNATLDAQSAATVAQYQAHARTLGVDQQITWINDYRPIEECIQLLEMADYVIYPYKHTRESASAAVTIGLATLKPVLVSPLPIFSDLADCTWRMAGESAQDIVEAVCTLERSPEYAQQLHAAQQTWLAERNWSRISARLDAITGGLLLDRRLEAAISDSRKAAFAARETPVSPVARLLVDVSALFFDEAETAIQRVVRGILGGLLASPPAGFSICPIYGTPDQAYRHTNRYSPAIEPGDEADHERPVKARAGDIFLGLDLSTPLFPRAEAALRDFRLAGARIHFVVCDMTPLRYPHYAPPARCHAVETGMRALARQADSLLCVSATVVTEVRIWLSQHTEDSPLLKVRHFHPGADSAYLASSPSLPAEASSLLAQIRSAPAFLLVGTLEPRMGQAQALAAFEALWRDEMPVNLVMIGKAGEMGDDFPVKIRAHPALGQRLFWLEESTDAFLEQIYAAGTCLIVACEAEGFALPLIEAARQHLPIIARDIPVLREVAGEHAHYFSGPQPEVLATTIRTWLTLNQAGLAPQSSAMPWQTWQQSTQQILDIILND